MHSSKRCRIDSVTHRRCRSNEKRPGCVLTIVFKWPFVAQSYSVQSAEAGENGPTRPGYDQDGRPLATG